MFPNPFATLEQPVHIELLYKAIVSLPIAALLGAALAFRVRRRGTPARSAPVIHTQIILAIVGALIMLVIGESMARAFGIVGAAGLIRYRAKIENPKDAGVMLSTLGVGLAAGVGLYPLAIFATIFILVILWIIESFEPEAYKIFNLKIATEEPNHLRSGFEAILQRFHIRYELRSSSNNELCYEVQMPLERKTDEVSNAILKLDGRESTAVLWEEKGKKG
ncbi:MAG: MgtC/SapB family protein [Acidobacteriota bacterium]